MSSSPICKSTTSQDKNHKHTFPKILMDPDERERFIQILEEDEDTVQSILNNGCDDGERKNIALRLWTGCLCAAKECRRTSVAEHNPDGTTKAKVSTLQRCFSRVSL